MNNSRDFALQQDYHTSQVVRLYLPTSKPPIKKRNKILMGVTGAFFVSSTTIWLSSKSNYNSYREVKNDIIYAQNNFTNSDLQQYKDKREDLFNKAVKQRKLSQYLFWAGVGTGSLTLTFYFKRDWRETPKL